MTNTKLVKEIISQSGLKLQFIADKLNISRYALSLKIDNKSEFKSSEISTLCKLLGIKSLKQKEKIFFAKQVDLKSTK